MLRDPSAGEVPWYKLIEVLAGVIACEALEGVGEPGGQVDSVELGSLDKVGDH